MSLMASSMTTAVSPEAIARYEPVIGLEVHVQLATRTKIFCGCPTSFGAPPNTNVCPVCLGLPGALPVLSRHAVELAIEAALALNCRVNPRSIFARKNYFYPDLPKGYQISQYDQPLAEHGYVDIEVGGVHKRIGITRVHMEDDAGKSIHEGFKDSDRYTYVDLNRSGTPLIEIVSDPDIRSADEAHAYLTVIKQVLQYVEVSSCDMEKGHLRCDANVSVRLKGAEKFGTKAEVKNLNSFRFLKLAVDQEIERQVGILESGGRVMQETRLFNPETGETVGMRSKEHAHDYRYFPEPDLVPLRVSEDLAERYSREDAGAARGAARAFYRIVRIARIRRAGIDLYARHERLLRESRRGVRRSAGGGELGDGRSGRSAQGRGQGNRRLARERGKPGASGGLDRAGKDQRQTGQRDLPENVYDERTAGGGYAK